MGEEKIAMKYERIHITVKNSKLKLLFLKIYLVLSLQSKISAQVGYFHIYYRANFYLFLKVVNILNLRNSFLKEVKIVVGIFF